MTKSERKHKWIHHVRRSKNQATHWKHTKTWNSLRHSFNRGYVSYLQYCLAAVEFHCNLY